MKVDIFDTDKKYQIIYADPPWEYKDKALAGNRGACCKYPTQSIEYLKKLPIPQISDTNCVLILWVTLPKLNECFELITSWGFEYKTGLFVWVKKNKKKDSWFWGMGRHSRSNAELCLLGMKGNIKRQSASVHQIIDSPIEKHSKKPDETRNRIIQLYGDLPKIELFAREYTTGWDVWGLDV